MAGGSDAIQDVMEVGALSDEAEAKLMRLLEDGKYWRVGGTKKPYFVWVISPNSAAEIIRSQ